MMEKRNVESRLSFLLFRSRSGSTFLGDRLGRHPDVLVIPESDAAPNLVRFFKKNKSFSPHNDSWKLINFLFSELKLCDWGLPKEMLNNEIVAQNASDWASAFHILCRTYRDWQKPGVNVMVFKKSGWYCRNMDLLLSTYPGSVMIGIIRDPRAVYNSARKAVKIENRPMARIMIQNALGWSAYIRRLKKGERRWPGRIILLKYEDLLRDLPGALAAVWERLGARLLTEKELSVVLAPRSKSNLVTDLTKHLHENVLKQPMMERIENWREELSPVRAVLIRYICRREMNLLGYH